MKLADFEKATTEELRQRVDELFADAEEADFIPQREARWSEARFYIAEIERREHDRVGRRDFWMEAGVIFLILVEIILSVYGVRLAIKQGNDADALMTKQTTVLNQLNTNMQTTAQTLQTSLATMQSMNDRLAVELGRMSQITVDFSLAGTKTSISNQGNVDLQFWGYKLGNEPAKLNKRPVLIRRSANVEIKGIIDAIHRAASGVQLQIYLRDDFDNEFVAEDNILAGPNIQGWYTRLQVVQRRWSSK